MDKDRTFSVIRCMKNLNFRTLIILFILSSLFNLSSKAEDDNSTIIKGYISNKKYKPIKLKISNFKNDNYFLLERNIEDFSIKPESGLMVEARNSEEYSIIENGRYIYLPKNTKFIGSIYEVIPEKKFNRQGYYKVNFDKVICPNGEEIPLKASVTSKSVLMSYHPWSHAGKTALGVVGGSLIGTLISYQLTGLAVAVGSKGYSLAAGAAVGGVIGGITGLALPGPKAKIAPGEPLNIIPVDEVSFEKLEQISCSPGGELLDDVTEKNFTPDGVDLKVVSVKQKKDLFGSIIKVVFELKNNSKEKYKISHFVLKDSSGKEYDATSSDINEDPFKVFLPNETTKTSIEFEVDYPKDSHWLVLKDENFAKQVGRWKIID